jgi:hypothetical protein
MPATKFRFGMIVLIGELLCTAGRAAADPVIFKNTSFIFGYVAVVQDGNPTSTGHFFDTSGTSQPQSGTWTVSDSRTISERGASATVASSVAATLSPTLFTGSGRTDSLAASNPVVSGLGAQSWGLSVFNVSFQLSEPFSFAYSGRYFGTSDSLFAGLVGRLEQVDGVPLFTDAFRFFPNSLDEMRNHSGILMPGSYSLILVSDPVAVIAPAATTKSGGFDFTFDLAPAAATPEPSSIVLLGLGFAGIVRRVLDKRPRHRCWHYTVADRWREFR